MVNVLEHPFIMSIHQNNDNDDNSTNNKKIIGTYTAEQVTQHHCICAFHYKDRVAIMVNPNTKVSMEHLDRGESCFFIFFFFLNSPIKYGRGVFIGSQKY
ncbi:hypothetical protein M9Y10_015438 [Tritrichomonas musculus]|uniref:Uncharacterized protein n=1 Tax=Tritrichomonas musculus TaxID=1915356 RepID=A0ABR2L360_9EUKA